VTVEGGTREIRDREEWNGIVQTLPHYSLSQGFEWGEVRSSQGWTPHRFAVFGAHGECIAAVSVLKKRLPLLGWAVLYAPGGPLLHNFNDKEAWDGVIKAIHDLAVRTRAVFVRVDPKVQSLVEEPGKALELRGFTALPDDWTTWNNPRIVMSLDLQETEEELKQKLRKRYREYIASAQKRKLTVRPARSLEEGRGFRSSLAAAGQRKSLPVRGHFYFERVWNEYIRTGRGVLLVAEHEGRAVGGLLGARLGQKATMLYAVVRDQKGSERLHQGPLLYWEFIRWAKAAGCSVIDWGGVGTNFPPHEDDPGFGLYHFKLGFNSRLEHLSAYYDLVFSPRRYGWFRFLERRVAAVAWTWRGRLNETFTRVGDLRPAAGRKLRQFQIGVRQRGLGTTLYWGAFGFLRPNRFSVMARDVTAAGPSAKLGGATRFSVWESAAVRAYREAHSGLPTEFYQHEIDGVELCVVAELEGTVAGLIWIYQPDDASRLFRLREQEAELNNGFVLPGYRGRGLFRDVILFACDWLKERGHRTVYAMVHSGNRPSQSAFEGAGFRRVSQVLHFLVFRPKVQGSDVGFPARPAQEAAEQGT
jgi:lipid II:glycine glycyltransferase (peptidoglycan interpeptide bridge formation enzyme)/ribosomal protein S18 acetylase RimI-like enzyme